MLAAFILMVILNKREEEIQRLKNIIMQIDANYLFTNDTIDDIPF